MKHDVLNKDKGNIVLTLGGAIAINSAKTVRGQQNNNFQRAVLAAIEDTQDKWLHLQELLRARYGGGTAAIMICALTHDDPSTSCNATELKDATQMQHGKWPNAGRFMLAFAALFLLNELFGRGVTKRPFRKMKKALR